jgi:hypothetical protein
MDEPRKDGACDVSTVYDMSVDMSMSTVDDIFTHFAMDGYEGGCVVSGHIGIEDGNRKSG